MKRGKLQVMLPSVPGACNLLFLAAVNFTFFFRLSVCLHQTPRFYARLVYALQVAHKLLIRQKENKMQLLRIRMI